MVMGFTEAGLIDSSCPVRPDVFISLLLLLSHLLKSQHTYHFIIQSPISQSLRFNHFLSMGGMTANCRNIYFHVISFSRQ